MSSFLNLTGFHAEVEMKSVFPYGSLGHFINENLLIRYPDDLIPRKLDRFQKRIRNYDKPVVLKIVKRRKFNIREHFNNILPRMGLSVDPTKE